jgi:hypothetical protein
MTSLANIASNRNWSLCTVEYRRMMLARMLSERDPGMLPLSPMGDLRTGYLEPELIYNRRLDFIAWEAAAYRITLATENRTIIDHAWLLGCRDGAFGFITEPYLGDEKDAACIVRTVRKVLAGWGVTVEHLPSEQSPWNPGRTTPIVVLLERHGLADLIAKAARAIADTVAE